MALRCVDAVQKIEANNCQAKDLRNYIKKKMKYGIFALFVWFECNSPCNVYHNNILQ